MSELLAMWPDYATGHLELTLFAMAIGLVFSVPTGIALTRRTRYEAGVLGVASVVQTIPSLALLALMVPALALLGVFSEAVAGVRIPSIGFLPALLALAAYSVLPMLRNTVTGIAGVDPVLVEAARGVGMTPRQQLLRVELPLALPVIVAGIRTAIVWVVGTATLATPVGATSLGNYIFSGLQTRNFKAVLLGSISAALLAMALDGLVRLLEFGIRERARKAVWTSLGVFALLYGYAIAALVAPALGGAEPPVRIGAKTFTEQYILADILAQRIRGETTERTQVLDSLGSTVLFDALAAGDIDLYVDYSGTIWSNVLKSEEQGVSRQEVLRRVQEFLSERYNIEVLGALGFENTYAFAMREDRALDLGVSTIGDLSSFAPEFVLGGDYEFFSRPEWRAARDRYRLSFRELKSMDPSLMYPAVRGGDVDAIVAFSTDGRIPAFSLVLLQDNLHVIPPYDAIVLGRPGLSADRPEVVAAIRPLMGRIDEAAMQQMNGAVDIRHETPAEVAAGFLAEAELDPLGASR